MDIKEVVSCPLGHVCAEAKDGKLHRCAWHVKMKGMSPDGNSYDQWECAITWQPILMLENASINRTVAASVDSLRNETVKRQDSAITLVRGISDAKDIINQ